ncbi:1-acyl-sn-glycerol-3-phosphate acyltransferase [Chitinophagaceae bacterium LB-8]|uniref:1-acyl-sn-glycerol-3-phosphate acyltransferase n=1 Tax=Paraflavisolibacter caeni TaxID=2982496 RepID=A0A9X3B8R8_9BACT|nr:lysophospholipid acyltransferase family protein [Paraflavisolibacter caeni]MCU7551135.1 1-acyl-sn-glycerol-3-phosphate acyltransferase [Paraflavisolibacter caeni]
MKLLIKPLQILYTLYALLLFVVIMLLVFPFVIIASFFGRIKGGNAIYRICVLWADIWFPLVFIRHKNIFEQKPRQHQSYIFVANHISYLDAALIVKTFRHPLRALGKVELSKVPIFGYIYKKAIVTVDRSSAANRSRSVHILKSVLRKEISILVFPEGTFNETEHPLKHFYDGAFRIAIETGTPIKPVLLLDSYDRMHYKSLFTFNPGRSRSVFLEEVPTKGLHIKDTKHLKEKVFSLMEAKLIEYKASWIKTGKIPSE